MPISSTEAMKPLDDFVARREAAQRIMALRVALHHQRVARDRAVQAVVALLISVAMFLGGFVAALSNGVLIGVIVWALALAILGLTGLLMSMAVDLQRSAEGLLKDALSE